MFGGGIGGEPLGPEFSGDAGDVDDMGFGSLAEHGQHAVGEAHGGGEVDVDDFPPFGPWLLVEDAASRDSRVVDEDVGEEIFLLYGRKGAVDIVLRCDVGLDEVGFAAMSLDGVFEGIFLFDVEVDAKDVGAVRGEQFCGGEAYAADGSGDEDKFVEDFHAKSVWFGEKFAKEIDLIENKFLTSD